MGGFLTGLSTHSLLYIKIICTCPDVMGKRFWVGKPVSMLIHYIGGTS